MPRISRPAFRRFFLAAARRLLPPALWLLLPAFCFPAGNNVLVVFSSDSEPYRQAFTGFKRHFAEKGLPLVLSELNVKDSPPEAMQRGIAAAKPSVILAIGTPALELARSAAGGIPVVFSMTLAPKLQREANITGVYMDIPIEVKIRELSRILPKIRRIGVMYSESAKQQYDAAVKASLGAGLKLVPLLVASEKDLPDAIAQLAWRIDCLLMIPDPRIYFPKSVEYILGESLREKFPVIGLSSGYTRAGALLSFDSDYEDMGRQAAESVARILSGARPADIPIAAPRRIKISMNRATAVRMGVRLSSSSASGIEMLP